MIQINDKYLYLTYTILDMDFKTIKENVKTGINTIIEKSQKAKDYSIYAKAKMYQTDAERYKFLNNDEFYKFFVKQIKLEYKKIETPEIKQKFEESLTKYIPKTWQNK
ncbi:hypothetical protein K9L67_04180 [Candidatus Woesearchaeota archaeon]|nr:hypothetical protein [Candidatus Woesearchaeota archaeon]MCF7901398.1 hypothetical protein [Candidatus Woesearchaeota archaeon]MCF8013728.1 hypothetical protein [Candidatus Woesearchaeota archaeon]